MDTALVTQNTDGNSVSMEIQLHTVEEAKAFALEIAKSGVFGDINASQALISLNTMKDEHLSMAQFKRRYRWVGNELTRIPNSLLGDFKVAGGKYKIHQADNEACDIEFFPKGDESYRLKITMEQMEKTGLPFKADGKTLKTNWRMFPDDMLFARVCGKALRRIAPELMGGVYTDGEAMDFDAPEKETIPQEDIAKRVRAASRKKEKTVEVTPVAVSESPISETPAKTEKTEAAKPEDEDRDAIEVCHINGAMNGKRWDEMTPDALKYIITNGRNDFPDQVTDKVIEYIENIFAEREHQK